LQPEQVTRWLGRSRFQRYLKARDNRHLDAVALYEWNAQVSAAFLEILCHVEVLLRNTIDRQSPVTDPQALLSILDSRLREVGRKSTRPSPVFNASESVQPGIE
jgi:hypothetical protein